MVKNREINGTEEIALVTPTPDRHARVYRRVGERFADCCIQETNGICDLSLMTQGAIHVHDDTMPHA